MLGTHRSPPGIAMKSLIILLLLLPLGVKAASELVFNTTGQSPLNRPDGSGFMDRVTSEALSRIGYGLKRVKLPAERGLVNVNRGIDDGEMSRIAGLDTIYTNMIRVPEKIMDWEFVVFSKKTLNLSQGWHSLNKKQLAFINGWKILEKNIPESALVNKVKTEKQLFLLLEKDRTDYVIFEKWAGLELIKNQGYKDIRLLLPPLAVKDMYIYLNKKHENLIAPLSNALKTLKQEGIYQNLEQSILMR